MAGPSTEQRELDLIEKVDFRILGVANNEEKLQALLKTYLPPLLLKAGSEHASVRTKAITLCQRLSTFIQPPSIVLPVAALLDQYKSVEAPLIKHFDLIFIQHSVGRLEPFERRKLIPKVIRGIGSDSGPSVSGLFNVLLRLLADLTLPGRGSKEDTSLREDVGLADSADAKFVATWFGKLLLLRSNATTSNGSPGLTDEDVKFLTLGKPDTWNPASKGLGLPETRIKVAGFLASGAFTDEERFIPAIYAASSSDSRVSSFGDDMLKRTTVSLEDSALVRRLFEAHSKLPAPYRIRILGLLSKSEISTTFTEEILAVFQREVTDNVNSSDAMQLDGPSTTTATTGLERTKIYRALFEFINWAARIGPKKTDFSKVGSSLIGLLREFTELQGWPKPRSLSLDETTLRSRAYETIGVLAKGTATPLEETNALVEWLFRSLAQDPTPDVVVNIDGALSSLTSIYQPPLDPELQSYLLEILMHYMGVAEGTAGAVRNVRHAVTKWANRCLPFTDVWARWIDILAIAGRRDERSDVIEEGQRGLDPWTHYVNNAELRTLPDWRDMATAFFVTPAPNMGLSKDPGQDDEEMEDDSSALNNSAFRNFRGHDNLAFTLALDYCKRILFLTALKDFKIEPGWARPLETLIHTDEPSRRTIRAYLRSVDSDYEKSLLYLLAAALEGMSKENIAVVGQCAQTFVDIASFAPRSVIARLIDHSPDLMSLVTSDKKEIRTMGAKAYGIVAAHPALSTDSLAQSKAALVKITKTMDTAVGSELNAVEGAFLALAHLLSRLAYYSPKRSEDLQTLYADLGQIFPTLDSVSSASMGTQEALIEAYTQLWTAGIQVAPDDSERNVNKSSIIKAFIGPLVVHAKKGNEKAIAALGRLPISLPGVDTDSGSDSDAILDLVLEKLYALHEIKQTEVQFAVGEAITAAIACWDAAAVQLTVDVDSDNTRDTIPKRPRYVIKTLEKILADCKTTKPSLLKASGIWLFCIIQHCSHIEEVQARLRQCQVAFTRLLSARDELVQETASRGLALVYEKGDLELRSELTRDLVATFTGTGPQLKVDEETELFDAGALPTGEGKSITSYKDIVNLANEVGDQSLVYKFMSLAANAATWSTRSAFGRFGLSNILSESETDPKLYPKLYRYRFDPNQNVQKSMNDIWKALVKDSNAVLEAHFDAIMEDLLKSVLGKEWRVRQASCAAISDLISGRPFQKYAKYYKDIWTAALRVLDDVKTTVRQAALHLCIALSTTLVRQLEESGSTASAKAMMNEALPFLLSDKGIESGVEDVKIFATITLIKIAKSGGKSLNPYIPMMVPRLLGILSTIEPDAINYHYLRAGEGNREKIDRIRSAMVSQSPITEAIENCMRSVDRDVMNELAPALEAAIKGAVGMPTKIGCNRVLTTLATRHTTDFAPYASRFLQIMEKQTLDRNDEVSQGYARATAYVMRVAPDEAKQRFVDRFVKLYLDSEDELRRQKVADVTLALSKNSPDHFMALEGQLLPFAYLAKHDTDEYVQQAFEEVWSKHAGSSLTVTRYIPEIVDLVSKSLNTAQWALKHAGALAIASAVAAVTSASDLSGQVNLENIKAVWPTFDKSLALKTFTGKEKLLDAFPNFVSKSKALWQKDAQFAEQLKKIAIREAKRNNDDYRPHAFRCLRRFAAARDDLSMLPEISSIVTEHLDLSEEEHPDAMDVDKSARNDKSRGGLDAKGQTAWAAIEAMAKGYNRAKMQQNPLEELRAIVSVLEENATGKKHSSKESQPYIAGAQFDAIRRLHWYECAAELLEQAAKSDGSASGSLEEYLFVVKWFLSTLDLDKAETGTEDQRLARTKAVNAALLLWKKQAMLLLSSKGQGQVHAGQTAGAKDAIKSAMERALKEERSQDVQQKWRECLSLLDQV
ncbi:ARM repeat-containing protein [Diplogelasinospora grovesii]|uniref:ARM repeat-containing protein n=1 Tax=Diplogelasinospora grovesii TaxID=303347 RepID=A0AAN6S359_9PEZI|nr:ARM repeat-containing protein [Diplogelasinospora grovesii]